MPRRRFRSPLTVWWAAGPTPLSSIRTMSTTADPQTRPPGRLRAAAAALIAQLAKFGVVGSIAYVVDVGLFNLLSDAGSSPLLAGQPLLAKVVSTGVATVVAWLGNRYWTFRH